MNTSKKLIFTICTGRSGQHTLAAYINHFGRDCLAEVEPPPLFYKANWTGAGIMRQVERKWFHTHEDLGRGKALLWHDNWQAGKLTKVAKKKLRRALKKKGKVYVEVSKFFIRSYCDAIHYLRSDIGVIWLIRNPMMNAKSSLNSQKDITLDNLMPDFSKTLLRMNIKKLTKYQYYLWLWVETNLRAKEYLNFSNIKHMVFKTEDLDNCQKMETFFDFFGIETRWNYLKIKPQNQGTKPTVLSNQDRIEFNEFVGMVSDEVIEESGLLEYL